jgi:hypothetical protein
MTYERTIETLVEALSCLCNAADDVGVRFFDTDTEEPEVTAMRLATESARAVLKKLDYAESYEQAGPLQSRLR